MGMSVLPLRLIVLLLFLPHKDVSAHYFADPHPGSVFFTLLRHHFQAGIPFHPLFCSVSHKFTLSCVVCFLFPFFFFTHPFISGSVEFEFVTLGQARSRKVTQGRARCSALSSIHVIQATVLSKRWSSRVLGEYVVTLFKRRASQRAHCPHAGLLCHMPRRPLSSIF